MDKKVLVSQHWLRTDYSKRGKLKTIITGWIIFLIIYGLTWVVPIRQTVFSFATDVNHSGLASVVNFIFNGLWVFFIPLVIGTIVTLTQKHPFQALCLYNTGVGFIDAKTDKERFADYPSIQLRYDKMQAGICIKCPASGVTKEVQYSWGEFTQPDVMRSNLERYAKINA